MSLSPNLAIALLLSSQSNKHVTINAMVEALGLGRAYLSKSVAGGAGTTNLTTAEARYGIIEATGVLTGNRVINMPTGMDHSVVIINSTTGAFTLSVSWAGGTTIVLPRGCATPVRKNAGVASYDFRDGNPKLPSFEVSRITSAQALAVSTDVVVQFNSETIDNAEAFDSATNYRFTAPATGLYEFGAQVEIEVTAAGTGVSNAAIAFRKNGTVIKRGDLIQAPTAATFIQRVGGRCLLQLTAGDYVDVIARQEQVGSTARVNFGADRTFFFGHAIRLGS